jgi:hypothetical protein
MDDAPGRHGHRMKDKNPQSTPVLLKRLESGADFACSRLERITIMLP